VQAPSLGGLLGPMFDHGADPAYAWHRTGSASVALVARNHAAQQPHETGAGPQELSELDLAGLPGVLDDVRECLDRRATLRREADWHPARSGAHYRLLLTHAPLTADVAVTTLRDVSDLWRALEEQRERAEELTELTNLTRSLLEPQDPKEVREAFCLAAMRLAGADAVFLAEPEGDALVQSAKAAADGMPEHETVRIPLGPWTKSVTRSSFLGGTGMFVEDLQHDPRVDTDLARTVGAGSGLFSPVVWQGRVLGEMLVAWRQPLPVPPERIARLMPLLAADAAVAIVRADLIARLDEAAQSDPLTGLPNRRASTAQLERHLAHAKRTGAPLSVAVLDVDGLKALNDREGHEAGDALLRAAADAWRGALRREDHLARVGGDEFVLLLPDTDLEEAGRAAERLRSTAPKVSVSIGLAQWRRGETPAALLARADELMYRDKQRHHR